MAKKKVKMTFQYWAESHGINPSVAEGVKTAEGITNTSRLTEDEFKSMVEAWLKQPVKGSTHG
ncbi:MAG: hypothetical protein ACE5D1_04685 [Fidelibacterota bacterium]